MKAQEAKMNMEELEHDERSEHHESPTQEEVGGSGAEGGVKRVRKETEGEVAEWEARKAVTRNRMKIHRTAKNSTRCELSFCNTAA